MPSGLTSLGSSAFYGCAGLKSLALPDSLTSIGSGAFSECPDLVLTVSRDSFAKLYAERNGLAFAYPDSNDWLNN